MGRPHIARGIGRIRSLHAKGSLPMDSRRVVALPSHRRSEGWWERSARARNHPKLLFEAVTQCGVRERTGFALPLEHTLVAPMIGRIAAAIGRAFRLRGSRLQVLGLLPPRVNYGSKPFPAAPMALEKGVHSWPSP
jgi:hypothetical protein